MTDKPRDQRAEQAIREFGSTALNVAQVRSGYVRRAQDVSASLRSAYRNGEMSAKAAAQAAQQVIGGTAGAIGGSRPCSREATEG